MPSKAFKPQVKSWHNLVQHRNSSLDFLFNSPVPCCWKRAVHVAAVVSYRMALFQTDAAHTVAVFVCSQQPTLIRLKTYEEKWFPCKECGGGSWASPNANKESQLWHAIWSLCVLIGAYLYVLVCMCVTMFFFSFFLTSEGRIKQLFLHVISSPVQSYLPDNFIPASPSCLSP